MKNDDPTLQDLIVRALTGRDAKAQRSLDAAAQSDPELEKFCAELRGIVGTLAAAEDWRSAPPSAEMTARIRQAVVSKLPEAPPHFRTVVLEADMGQRKSIRSIIYAIIALAMIGGWIAFFALRGKDSDRLALTRKVVFENPLTSDAMKGLERVGDGQWAPTPKGIRAKLENGGGAGLFVAESFAADKALAFEVEVLPTGPLDKTQALVYLADAKGAEKPAFDAKARPQESALALEISTDGLVLNGKGGALLQSKPLTLAAGKGLKVRLEYLGGAARVLVNNEVFFDGALSRPAQGPLHPGLRVLGPAEIHFTGASVER